MTSLCFQARIEINGINPYVRVDADQAATLQPGWRKPMPVRIRVNGQPARAWPVNLIPMGNGAFYLYLHGDVRKASATGVGGQVTVDVAFDPLYRSGPAHPIPSWFGQALQSDATARQAWDALRPSLQKEILRYFARLTSEQAKARNLELAMHVLRGGRGRFLARSWNDRQ